METTIVWEKCFEYKIRIGLVITIKGCVRIIFRDGNYFVEVETPDFRWQWELPAENKTFEFSIPVPVLGKIGMELALERRGTNPEDGYRIVLRAKLPIVGSVQIFAVVVKFGQVQDALPAFRSFGLADEPAPSQFFAFEMADA